VGSTHLSEFWTNVNHALHTSPSVYKFLKNTMRTQWGVDSSNINIMAHSLGNMVMWDALRVNQFENGGQLVHNVIGVEPAVWPETFALQEPEVYTKAEGDDDDKTYTTPELTRNSWKFWFKQTEHEAKKSMGGNYYHSYLPDDSVLVDMRWSDWKRFTGIPHYTRLEHPEGRPPNTLSCMPTLMTRGQRYLRSGKYLQTQLNAPVGMGKHPDTSMNTNPVDESLGWRATKHSDFIDQPIYLINPWYKTFLKEPLGL
jgi:hypothetical protein